VDIVDVFRKSEDVPLVVDNAIKKTHLAVTENQDGNKFGIHQNNLLQASNHNSFHLSWISVD
jgi:predicted CoA-binding protein